MAELKTRIIIRNDSTENWTANKTTVLKKGEIGIEFLADGKIKQKIGDGTTTWENLAYFGGEEAKTFQVGDLSEITDEDLAIGDTAIVKKAIYTDAQDASKNKYSYTGYVYNGTAWAAMDGNYNANNVYFDKDFTYTANIGVKTVPTSGSGTIAANGKNVQELLASILAEEKNPTVTPPSASITMSAGNGTVEIGTKVNVTYSASLNGGKYQYGPATGVSAKSYSVSFDDKTATTATGSFADTIAEAAAKKLSVTIAYDASTVNPKTNIGNDYPAGKIAAGSKTATSSGQVLGVRHMFWGAMKDGAAELNSANIRALSNHKATVSGQLASSFIAGSGAKKIVVAMPSDKTITKVLLASSMNADITSQFVKQSGTVAVEGANAYAAANYNVYVYQPASIDAAENYNITIG